MTTLTILNKEMERTIKIVKSLEDSCSLIKRVAQTIKNETKETKGWISYVTGYIRCKFIEK